MTEDPLTKGEMAERFVQFIMIQAQNILFVLGKLPTPEGALAEPNLETAKMLIDQLLMIKAKTKGNLGAQEEKIFEDVLSQIQLAFVEASGGTPASMMPDTSPKFKMREPSPPSEESAEPEAFDPDLPLPPQAEEELPPEPPSSSEESDENKKKFFKSYG